MVGLVFVLQALLQGKALVLVGTLQADRSLG
jgi:hypothetical protein